MSNSRQSRGSVTICSTAGLCSHKLSFCSRVMPYCPCCVQAAHNSNVSASVCLAQVDDARGDMRSALKYWARAAKLGHPEAQFRLGRVRLRSVTSACWNASVCLHKGFTLILNDSVKPVQWLMMDCLSNCYQVKGHF